MAPPFTLFLSSTSLAYKDPCKGEVEEEGPQQVLLYPFSKTKEEYFQSNNPVFWYSSACRRYSITVAKMTLFCLIDKSDCS